MISFHVPSSSESSRPTPTFRMTRGTRKHVRFPVNAQAEYILGERTARAITQDISSGGVLLKTDSPLPIGKPIQVLIDWPAPLDRRCPLRLEIFGKVLRSNFAGTAVGITRYEFRIRAQKRAESTVEFGSAVVH